MSDTVTYSDVGTWDLANRVSSTANATETCTFPGSHYHITLTDSANASETAGVAHSVPAITETANATATLTDDRALTFRETANAIATLADSKTTSTITLTDSANATEAAGHSVFGATVSETANVTGDAAAPVRALVVSDSANATETTSGLRKATATTTDSADATDTTTAGGGAIVTTQDTADASCTVIGVRRVTETIVDSGGVAATDASIGKHVQVLTSTAAVVETTSQSRMTAQALLISSATAEDSIRLPAGSVPNLWTNSITGAAATWDGLPFNSLIEADGVVLAAGVDGLFRLTNGVDDNAVTPIDWAVLWDLNDFGSPQRKRLAAVYVAAASSGPFTVHVGNEQGDFDYTTRLPRSTQATNHRALPGRGLESAYFRVGVSGTQDDAVDHVIVEHDIASRRL